MIDKNSIAQTVIILSLDASLYFYNDIGINNYQAEISQLFKTIVKAVNQSVIFKNLPVLKYYGFETYPQIYINLEKYIQTLSDDQSTFLRKWFWNAFSGQHCSDVSLSSWKDILIRGETCINHEEYNEKELHIINDLFHEYDKKLDLLNFIDKRHEASENGQLTDYDREVHRLYEYSYDDDIYDPFIIVATLQKGYITREFVKTSKNLQVPFFPFEKFLLSAIKFLKSENIWGADYINDILTIKEFHKDEYKCPK